MNVALVGVYLTLKPPSIIGDVPGVLKHSTGSNVFLTSASSSSCDQTH